MTDRASQVPTRTPPPPFRVVSVIRTEPLSPRMTRVSFGGSALAGFPEPESAASVRLLLPGPAGLVIPEWNGNEFLLPNGKRPVIRTFTPRAWRPGDLELDVDIVLHDGGAVSTWAGAAAPGTPAALSGPGSGYRPDPAATGFLLGGDETAIPAIAQLLEVLPPEATAFVLIGITHPDAQIELPEHPRATVRWLPESGASPGAALVAAIEEADLPTGTKVWVAGEAAAMHRIRRLLFQVRGLPRQDASVRGYWKQRG